MPSAEYSAARNKFFGTGFELRDYLARVISGKNPDDTDFFYGTQRIFDVRDYGAVANDDSKATANSAAIALAVTDASNGGGIVRFVGLFTIQNSVAPKNNVTLEGVGPKSGVRVASGRDVAAIINYDTTGGNSDITIRGMYLDANKSGRPAATSPSIRFLAADATPCQNVSVEGCFVDGSMQAGIMLQNVQNFRVLGNHVQNTERDGITIWFNSTDGVIANNVAIETGDDCIALNSEFAGHTGAKCQRIAITGNSVRQRYDASNFGGGIHVLGAEDVTISGNTITKSMGPNIWCVNGYVSGASMPTKRITISGNTCKDSRDASAIGIGVNTVGAVVSGNTISGYFQQGIQCDAPTSTTGNYLLAGTTVSSNGVYVSATGTGTAVNGNRFEGCAATGVTIGADRCSVSGNTFKDCGALTAGQAYCLINANINRTSVVGNAFHFVATGSFGVRIASGTSSRNIVMSNVAQGFAAGSSFSDGSTSGTNIVRDNSPSDDPITIASGSTVRLDRGSRVYKVSGTTNIDTITATGREGDMVTLIFTAALTVNDSTGNLKLVSNFVTTADDVLQLVCDGTNWFEAARSAN